MYLYARQEFVNTVNTESFYRRPTFILIKKVSV